MVNGVVYKDLLPIPAEDPTKVEGTTPTLTDQPTESHALAMEAAKNPELQGAAQVEHGNEVVDLGWNEPKEAVSKPLVGGLSNEDVWVLVRRFNKQMYHVKEIPNPPPGGLDVNIADEEEFSPDKLRSNIERLYMTIGIGLMAFAKHIVRLRSWRETRRTSSFCAVYFAAWFFNLLVPLLSLTLIALIAYPPARSIMFPPAPIALVSASTGGVQKPKAGTLGSHDSATGAPENHKGEAVEQEANSFVTGIASIALSSAAGKHPQGEPPAEADSSADGVPDPTLVALGTAEAKDKAAGVTPTKEHDKTKVPMETAMWTKMRPIMHGIADVTDTWERFANALSPAPPFPQDCYRLRLAALVAPVVLLSLFVTSYMFVKGVTFGVGFGFFGDPVIKPAFAYLNRKFPNWQKLLELRNTVLKSVPTNAQLTITLLRIGEANKAPLPPPPHIAHPPPEKLNATGEELDEAMTHDPSTAHETSGSDIDASKNTKHGKKGRKILGFFKGTMKGGVETTIGADKVKAAVGDMHAKNRLGAVPKPDENLKSGPVKFKARYKGQKGHVYITAKATIPCVAFSTDSSMEKIGSEEREDLHPLWSIPIGEIKEMRKVGGYGWKAKLVVGWATDREVADGLEIIVKEKLGEVEKKGEPNKFKVTAIPLRDEWSAWVVTEKSSRFG